MTDPYIISGTGSRTLQAARSDIKMKASTILKAHLKPLLQEHPDAQIMSGMAEGFDKLLALTAIELGVPLICAIPNKGYGRYYWGQNSVSGHDMYSKFKGILSQAAEVVYIMEDVHKAKGLYLNGVHSNFLRNDYMVTRGDFFFVWSPTTRGTKQCYQSILASGKPHMVLGDGAI